MYDVISEVIPFFVSAGVCGGFAAATLFNLLAKGISGILSLFSRF